MTVAVILMVLAVALAYANSFSGPFIFDDVGAIESNPTIRRLWPVSLVFPPDMRTTTVDGRPVLNFTFALNYAFGGLRVGGYHLVNLLIHLLAGLALLGVLRRTFLSPALRARYGSRASGLALAIALLWAVHPLQTESVTYLSQRAESLVSLFYLLTIYSLLRIAEGGQPRAWSVAAVGACLLGMATKEVMITAPVVTLLFDRAFLAGSLRRALNDRRGLYLGLGATWGLLLALMVANSALPLAVAPGGGIERWRYLFIESTAITRYLALSFWPSPLILDYGPLTWPGFAPILPHLLVVSSLLFGTALTSWRRRAIGFAGVWFFAILAPTSSLVPLDEYIFEHRMYLPLAAVLTLAVLAADALGSHLAAVRPALVGPGVRRAAAVGLLAVAVCVLAALTSRRNDAYASSVSIWADTVAKRPDNPRARVSLGSALQHAGDTSGAIRELRRALSLDPAVASAHFSLGVALQGRGELGEAEIHYREAIRIAPSDAQALHNLGILLMATGKEAEAQAALERAVLLSPDSAYSLNALGALHERRGDALQAAAWYSRALAKDPEYREARENLARIGEGGGGR